MRVVLGFKHLIYSIKFNLLRKSKQTRFEAPWDLRIGRSLLPASRPLPNPLQIDIFGSGYVMRDVASSAPKCRPGAGIYPFVGFDMAISKGDNALSTMRTGRIMDHGILNHVHSETWGAEAGRINVHENEALRRKIGGETCTPEMNLVVAANLDRSHLVSRGAPQVRVHGVAADSGNTSISGAFE